MISNMKKNYDYPFEWVDGQKMKFSINIKFPLNKNKIILRDLISKYRIDDFKSAYEDILKDKSYLGILFEYDSAQDSIQAAKNSN